MKPLAIMTAATLTALALMLASPVNAHTRPKPRPAMDCWMDENGNLDGCRVRK